MALNFPWLDGILVRSTIWGEDGTGTVRPVLVDASGALVTAGGGGGGGTAKGTATAAAPTYVEGSDNALSLDLAGNLRVLFANTSIAVTGTFWQATQPVSSTQLPAALGQTVMADSLPVTIASNQSALLVYKTDLQASGSITNTQSVVLDTTGKGGCKVQITGTWTGTIMIEQTVDGVTWTSYGVFPLPTSRGLPLTAAITSNGLYMFNGSGAMAVRARGATVTSGQADIAFDAGVSPALITANLIDDGVVISSTSTPLGNGGSWTSGTLDLLAFASVGVYIFADQLSAATGLVLEWSANGTTWTGPGGIQYTDAGQDEHIIINRRARYFRVTYTNGTTPQGTFLVQIIGQKVSPQNTNILMNEPIKNGDMGQLVRSVITGMTTGGGGGYVNVKVNPSGALTVAASQDTSPWVVSGTVGVTNANLDAALSTLATKAQFPTTIGQTDKAHSLSVAIASDQTLGGASVLYNAVPPTFVEAATGNFSSDLYGHLRVLQGNAAGPTITATGTLANIADTVTLAIKGATTVIAQLAAGGTLSGATVYLEVSLDGGTTYSNTYMRSSNTIGPNASIFSSANNNPAVLGYGTRFYVYIQPGITHVRWRLSANTSGSATANLWAYEGPALPDSFWTTSTASSNSTPFLTVIGAQSSGFTYPIAVSGSSGEILTDTRMQGGSSGSLANVNDAVTYSDYNNPGHRRPFFYVSSVSSPVGLTAICEIRQNQNTAWKACPIIRMNSTTAGFAPGEKIPSGIFTPALDDAIVPIIPPDTYETRIRCNARVSGSVTIAYIAGPNNTLASASQYSIGSPQTTPIFDMDGGLTTAATPAYTDATANPLSLDMAGRLRTSAASVSSVVTLGQLNDAATVAVLDGIKMVHWLFTGGTTLNGSATAEVSRDGGATWNTAPFYYISSGGTNEPLAVIPGFASGLTQNSPSGVAGSQTNGWVWLPINATHFRIRCSSYTSGSVGVIVRGQNHSLPLFMAYGKDNVTVGSSGSNPGNYMHVMGGIDWNQANYLGGVWRTPPMTGLPQVPKGGSAATVVPGLVVRPVPDVYQLDAFGAARTTQPLALFDYTFRYGIDTNLWETSLNTGTATVDVNTSSVALAAPNTTSGTYAKIRTNQYWRYQAGRGQRILMTMWHANSGLTNQKRTWGYGDTNNGLFFQLNGTALTILRRSFVTGSIVETVVNRNSWNGDQLNGSNDPANTTLDITKGNIYEINLEWLGVGIVRFFINGILVHTLYNPNTIAAPYMSTGSLPITAEIENTGVASASTGVFNLICCTVYSEGGSKPVLVGTSYVGGTVTTTTAAETPAFSIRLKSTFNTADNRITAWPTAVNADNSTSNAAALVVIRRNATLTGATWAVDPGVNVGCEIDTAATVVSGGTVVSRFIVQAGNSNDFDLTKLFDFVSYNVLKRLAFTGTSDTLTISVTRVATTNVSVVPTLYWNETR